MLKSFSFHRLATLTIALATPGLLFAGANAWTGSLPAGNLLQTPALIASSPDDPDVVYSAQDSVLYRSVDGGRTWIKAFTFVEISAVYVQPTSPSTVFVGAWREGSLAGIYKSVDGGATWTQPLSASVHIFVNHFAASDAHPSTLYASTYGGIYRSDDAGEHWEELSSPRAEDSHLSQEISVLLIDPADKTTPEVGGFDYAYPDYSPLAPFFRKSADAGETWSDLSAGLSEHASVSAIAIDPAHLSTVFVGMDRFPATPVFRSANGGASWSPAATGLPAGTEVSALVMDPLDPQTLYAGTKTGVFRTRDAGASWLPFGQLLNGMDIGSLSFDSIVQNGNDLFLRAGTGLGVFALELGAGALDVAAGNGRSHVLTWDADRLSVHTLADSGADTSTPPEGPSGSWLATAISDGADGLSRVLWVNGDGRASLEIVGSAGSVAVFRFASFPEASAADVSVGADGSAHLLWTNARGGMYIATVDASGAVTDGRGYGPYPSWTALALADSPDGSTWVLWRATDGRSSVSVHRGPDLAMEEIIRFDARPSTPCSPPTLGCCCGTSNPFPAVEDITVGADGRPRLLRVGVDGMAEVSTIDAHGEITDAQTYGVGWFPRRIAAGADGFTRLLWADAGGGAHVWLLNPDNSLNASVSQPARAASHKKEKR
jgi:hypothetical protein